MSVLSAGRVVTLVWLTAALCASSPGRADSAGVQPIDVHLLLRAAPLALVLDAIAESCDAVARISSTVTGRGSNLTMTLIGSCGSVGEQLERAHDLRLWRDGDTLWVDAADDRHDHALLAGTQLLPALRSRLASVELARPPRITPSPDGTLRIVGVRDAVVVATREAAALLAERRTASVVVDPVDRSDPAVGPATRTFNGTGNTARPRKREVSDIPGFDTEYR